MNTKRIVVIGAGIGGLSAAAYLSRAGHAVTVLEKNDWIGGRVHAYSERGFTFDMGPTWYWMPEVFEQFFRDFGTSRSAYYDLQRLRPSYRAYFPGCTLDIPATVDGVAALFERYEPGSGTKLRALLEQTRAVYDIAMQSFIPRDYLSLTDILDPALLTAGFRVLQQYNGFLSVRRFLSARFRNPMLVNLLSFPIFFLGESPRRIPAVYSLMNHVDTNLGTWHPVGGFVRVAAAVSQVAMDAGATILTGQEAVRIKTVSGKATAVLTQGGREYPADVVIADSEYSQADALLAASQRNYPADSWNQRRMSPSAWLLYLGLNRKLPGLRHHSLFFTNDWDTHEKALFDTPAWPDKPLYYVSVPTKTDSTLAPPGYEAITILVPLASGLPDSQSRRRKLRETILSDLENRLKVPIRRHIVTERMYGSADFSRDFHAYKGNAYGLAHTWNQTAIFRPPLRNRHVSNFWYTGQGTVPGIGVPMVLLSGKLVSTAVNRTLIPTSRAVFKAGSTTFFTSSVFFQADTRRDVERLYAFVRTVDDFVDTTPQDRQGFAAFVSTYTRATAGLACGNPIIDDFVMLERKYNFAPEWMRAFFRSMEMDLAGSAYRTLADTEAYIYGSAGTIGLCMSRLMHLPARADRYALLLGKSFQFINCLRDIAEDHRLGRCYFPQEDLQRCGLTSLAPETVRQQPEAFAAFIRLEITRYRNWQREAGKGFRYMPRHLRIPVATAADMYTWTADRISRDPFIIYRKKVKPSPARVLLTGLKQMWLAQAD